MERIKVVDSIMGRGKTTALIQFLTNDMQMMDHWVIVVPVLSEIDRWIKALRCEYLPTPVSPQYRDEQNKTEDFKKLLRHHAHLIIVTHSLFDMIDNEIVSLIQDGKYSLIIDEVPVPVSKINLKDGDLRVLMRSETIVTDPDSGNVKWNPDFIRESTSYSNLRDLCLTGKVYYDKKANALFKISPYEVYVAAQSVYILTYMFEAQIIYYFFMQNNIKYDKWSVIYDSEFDEYMLIDYHKNLDYVHDLKSMIHICDNPKLNLIGKKNEALSLNWFAKHPKEIADLKKNIFNYGRNICKAKGADVLWTTFSDYQKKLEVSGYKNDFLSVNAKATNDFSDRTVVMYLANRFISPQMLNYFNLSEMDIKFDKDAYALSEMLQFIWRSAIRNGKPINLYIPSSRMRGLLEKWIEENSVTDVA